MSTVSLNELKTKPIEQWVKAAGDDDLILTADGEPVALLLGVEGASVETTRTLVRRVRALQAQHALAQEAARNGTANLSDAEIEDEIRASRRDRRGQ